MRVRPVASAAWADGRSVWRRLLVVDLLFKLLAFALLTPLVGLAFRAGAAAAGNSVLADMEILFFLFRPLGLILAVVCLALSVAIVALEQASLMAIAFAAAEGVRLERGQVLRFLLIRLRVVVGLALRLVTRVLALAAPFLAGIGLVYFGLLREFDINYYLSQKPPAFFTALAVVAALVAGLAWVLVPRLVAWSLALPLVLFEEVRPGAGARRERAAHSGRAPGDLPGAHPVGCRCLGARVRSAGRHLRPRTPRRTLWAGQRAMDPRLHAGASSLSGW